MHTAMPVTFSKFGCSVDEKATTRKQATVGLQSTQIAISICQ